MGFTPSKTNASCTNSVQQQKLSENKPANLPNTNIKLSSQPQISSSRSVSAPCQSYRPSLADMVRDTEEKKFCYQTALSIGAENYRVILGTSY